METPEAKVQRRERGIIKRQMRSRQAEKSLNRESHREGPARGGEGGGGRGEGGRGTELVEVRDDSGLKGSTEELG